MKKMILGAILTATLLAQAAHAELSANIGVASNYVWRGVTQTDDSAAVQGGVDYSHASGLYAGTWVSNIDWGNSKGTEVDLYLGFSNEIGDLGYDVGVIKYMYPDENQDDSDFAELYVGLSYKILSGGIAYTFASDASDDAPFAEGDLYYHVGLDFELEDSWSLSLLVGYYEFDVPSSGDVDYTHGQINLTKSIDTFGDFTLSVSKAEEDSGGDDTKVFVAWNKSF